MKAVLASAILVVVAAMAAGEVVTQMTPCENVKESMCTVSELRVTPCKSQKSFCRLKTGRDFQLSFDFTPNFDATELMTAAYKTGTPEMLFDTLGVADACQYATCPAASGAKNTFNYNLHIGRLLPRGTFPLKWTVWNKANESQMCCFETTVTLV